MSIPVIVKVSVMREMYVQTEMWKEMRKKQENALLGLDANLALYVILYSARYSFHFTIER